MDSRLASEPGAATREGGSTVGEVHAEEENLPEATGHRPTPVESQHQPQHQPQSRHECQPQHQHHSRHDSYGYRHQHQHRHHHPEQLQQQQRQLQHPLQRHLQQQQHQRDAQRILQSETPNTLAPCRTVDRLVRKLSRQRLRQGRSSPRPMPPPPTPATFLETPDFRRLQDWIDQEIEIDPDVLQYRRPDDYLPEAPSGDDRSVPWLPVPTQHVGEPIEIDEAYLEPPDESLVLDDRRLSDESRVLDDRRPADARRVRRQPSSHLRGTSSRPADRRRLETMIESGEQCNVRSETRPAAPAPPLPPPTLTLAAEPAFIEPDPAFIEPDPECAMPIPELEVDDTDGGISELPPDLLTLADGILPSRYAGGSGGIRKYSTGGVALRYRLSVDAALRCTNVVRSRPRMRKRTKTRLGSTTSSALTSPAMSSAPSPPPMLASPLSFQ